MPSITSPNFRALQSSLQGTQRVPRLSLAVGGWGDDTSHERILEGFRLAGQDPGTFVDGVSRAADRLEEELGSPITTIDLDWEFPQNETEAQGLVEIARILKARGFSVTLAVPADTEDRTVGYYLFQVAPQLVDLVDTVRVMSYDLVTPYDGDRTTTGFAFDGQQAIEATQKWADAFNRPGQIQLGVPAHAFVFADATGVNTGFTKGGIVEETTFADIVDELGPEAASVNDDLDRLTSSVTFHGGWVSYASPRVVEETIKQAREAIPTLGGVFVWEINGTTEAFNQAMVDGLAS